MSGDTLVLYITTKLSDDVLHEIYVLKDFETDFLHVYVCDGLNHYSFKSERKTPVCDFIYLIVEELLGTKETEIIMDLVVFPDLPVSTDDISYSVLFDQHETRNTLYTQSWFNNFSMSKLVQMINVVSNLGNDVTY